MARAIPVAVQVVTCSTLLACVFPPAVWAQIIPDTSLGTNPSVVVPASATRNLIEGGVTQNDVLFHSFQDFNIDNGNSVYFANPSDIDAIFTRVTGTSLSQIDGTLGVLGNADLFLLNPYGIVFGAGSQLDIGGSFTASTAESFEWPDGSRFSAVNPAAPPLLTVDLVPGVQQGLSDQAADITVQASQLSVGQDLTLLGGKLDIQGLLQADRDITLTAADTVQIGELSDPLGAIANGSLTIDADSRVILEGFVIASDIAVTTGSLTAFNGAGLVIQAPAGIKKGDLAITATGTVTFDTGDSQISTGATNRVFSGETDNGGDISIIANRLELLNGAIISTSTSGAGDAGKVTIEVADTTLLAGEDSDGFGSGIFSQVNSIGQANSQGIFLTTGSLIIRDGGELATTTRGRGNAGPIRVIARDTVSLDGFSSNGFETGLFSNADIFRGRRPRGSAGEIFISADSLAITNGAFIGSNAFGIGNPGAIMIQVSDHILIAGSRPRQPSNRNSSIITQVGNTATSLAGGSISISTRSLRAIEGGSIGASTFGQGPAGTITVNASESIFLAGVDDGLSNGIRTLVAPGASGDGGEIQINTDTLSLTEGATITTETTSSGNGGRITINADTVDLNRAGQLTASTSSGSNAGSINLNITDSLTITDNNSGIFSEATETATGSAGSIFIDPRVVTLREGAAIRVANQGPGIGGDIQLVSGQLMLDGNTSISAETASNQGGDITLLVDDVVLLRNGSNISATAGIKAADGDGGNVTIDTNFLIGTLDEDNNITANAFLGRGGNVEITALGTYGLEFQADEIPVRNDITASSAFGTTGEVNVNTLELDPTRDTTELPNDTGTPTISQRCNPNQGTSSFVATGRGGIPLGPEDAIAPQALWEELDIPDFDISNIGSTTITTAADPDPSIVDSRLVEAQGWSRDPDGNVELLATVGASSSTIPIATICSSQS